VVVDVADLDLETRQLGGLLIVNAFYDRLGIGRLLDAHVPGATRLRLASSTALGVVIRNLVVRHAPVYALGECASRYEAVKVGLRGEEAELLNDDRSKPHRLPPRRTRHHQAQTRLHPRMDHHPPPTASPPDLSTARTHQC
jgi:hypothetical protein